ncbi:MAG: SRPBCC family protein [Eubacteriales bacterium]|nr:SRPBCC family protein [Eubacteriales bacterium]
MAVSSIKAFFECNISKVWDIVTSLEDYAWRSDLGKIEILSALQFVEYTKDGYATTFTITKTDPCKRWEFDMENENMKGHWTGIFSGNGDGTEIEFIEEVTAKKLIMKPFVKMYLKKQQALYIEDLKKAVAD